MDGVIVIADESCAEDIAIDSQLDSFVPVIDAVVVIIGMVFVQIFVFAVDLVVVIAVVETVALLLSLFAKRLLISVEVLVVGIGIDVVIGVGVEISVGEDALLLLELLPLVVEVLLFFGGALRCALRMGDINWDAGN